VVRRARDAYGAGRERKGNVQVMPPSLAVMPAVCPHEHPYLPGSFAMVWEACPCEPRSSARRGHYLLTCWQCVTEQHPALVNVPYCYYLDF
jgi:hypothetical protein